MSSSKKITIRISRIDSSSDDIPIPQYSTDGASGMDVCAAVKNTMIVKRGETVLVPTGFRIEVPANYEAQLRPRSGLAIQHGITLLNSPGTIDSDYRGEVKIVLSNFGKKDFVIKRGDRIAQMVIAPVVHAILEEVPEIENTARGSGGFGHTGITKNQK